MAESLALTPIHRFLHDVASCLALASQGRLRLGANGHLTPPSLMLVRRHTGDAPAGLPDGVPATAYPGFLVRLAGQAGMLGAGSGGALHLSAEANAWLGRPAHQQIGQLRVCWLQRLDLAWRWLPSGADYSRRDGLWRGVVLGAMEEIAAACPGDRLPLAGLAGALEARGMLSAGGPGCRLPHVRRSVTARARQVLGFVACRVLPGLGLVEMDEGTDPLLHATVEGRAWLRAALAHLRPTAAAPDAAADIPLLASGPRLPLADEASLEVGLDEGGAGEPALLLTLSASAPALCVFEVAHLAALLSPSPPASYRLTRRSFCCAIEWGYSAADTLILLGRFGDPGLPPGASELIRAWSEETTTIACQWGFRLHLAAPEILADLRRRDPFRQRSLPLATGQDAWVGAAQAGELFRYLRRLGYALQQTPVVNSLAALAPALLPSLPLASTLVVLRTYERLRGLVPGLALLDGLKDLDNAISSALIAEDLAGVERLVESHGVFLRHHLRPGPKQAEAEGITEEQPGQEPPGGAAAGRDTEGEGREEHAAPAAAQIEAALETAIASGRPVELSYADTQGQQTRRRVRPLHLEVRWGRRYLLAFCELRQDERHFRLDRIVDLREA